MEDRTMTRRPPWSALALLACLPMLAHAARAADPARTLGQYHWQLSAATDRDGHRLDALFAHPDKPLQLDFADGRLRISHTCNAISGGYRIDGGKLDIGPLNHTMMFCADKPLMAMERDASARLRGALAFRLLRAGGEPQLRLTTADGDTLLFTGQPTPETRYGGPGTTEFLEVAPQTVPCAGPAMAGRQCLSVRERHYDDNGLQAGTPGPWHPLEQPIEGYAHQPGVRNVLRVKRYAVRQPAAGAPSSAYVLDMVVESHAPTTDTATDH
jgi:heat shock protein HslJ